MSIHKESKAVDVARAHVEAWSNHDFEAARKHLAAKVHVTVTTTQQIMKPTNTVGVDEYMQGLTQFASAVAPGSAREIATIGDERNALLMLTVQADFGAGKTMLPAARLYLIDEDDKIEKEQVIFFAAI